MKPTLKKRLLWILCAVLLVSSAALAIPYGISHALSSGEQFYIYDESTGWNKDELDEMAIAAGYLNIASMVSAAQTKNATMLLGTTSDNTLAGAEWSVVINSIEFTPVYLSKDKNNNVILTLWQSYAVDKSVYNNAYSNSILRDENENKPSRSNNYATSVLRTQALNNTGVYYDYEEFVAGKFSAYNYTSTESHAYSDFISGVLSNYIVKPNDVSWQLQPRGINDLQFVKEGYSDRIDNYYNEWGDDTLWLPSQYELYNRWFTTVAQRRDVTDSWLRSYSSEVEIGEETNNNWIYADKISYNGTADVGTVDSNLGVRPAFHLNLTAVAQKHSATQGYTKTTTSSANISLLQSAWQYALDNSGKTGASLENNAAKVFYDTNEKAVTFKLKIDWGASGSGYNIFGGSTSSTTGYYYYGALYVPSGKTIRIDLNGHTINRNMYNPSAVGTSYGSWPNGYVIYVLGTLIVDDSTANKEFINIDANGLSGVGRITGGKSSASAYDLQGSGVKVYTGGKFIFRNGAICYNDATARGGAVHTFGATFTMTGGYMLFNNSTSLGGGVYPYNSTVNISGGNISYNTCVNKGGGIYLPEGANTKMTVSGLDICYNYANLGGGIYGAFGTSNAVRNVFVINDGCNFIGNRAARGGALYVMDTNYTATLTVNGGYFADNRATEAGGFVWVGSTSTSGGQTTISINGGVIENNTAPLGGAIYLDGALPYKSTVNVTGGSFVGNTATNQGGGIYMGNSNGTGGVLNMTGGEFVSNSATNQGGGVYLASGCTFNMRGGSFTENIATTYPGFYCGGTINVAGSAVVKDNRTRAGVLQNIYLATEATTINVTGALNGAYLGISKALPSSNKVNVAKGSGYTLGTRDVLCFYNDSTDDEVLFTVNSSSNLVFMAKGIALHTHTYDNYTHNPTCTEQGYTVRICTGCQEILENADGTLIISFIAPKGHNYVWNLAKNAFVCSDCGDKQYLSLNPLNDRYPYTQAEQTPLISGTVYSLDKDKKQTTLFKLTTAHFDYAYQNNIDVSTPTLPAVVLGTIKNPQTGDSFLTTTHTGEHFYPRGQYTGVFTGQFYSYQDKFSGTVQQPFRIAITMTNVSVTPYNMSGGWYVSDSEAFFSLLSVEASIGKGTCDVTDDGYLQWLVNGSYRDDPPELTVSPEGGKNRYYWKWISKTDENLDPTIGYIDVVVQRLIAQKIEADKTNSAVIYDDISFDTLKSYFSVEATYAKMSGETGKTEKLKNSDYTIQLVDSNGRVYSTMRAGTYTLLFTYTYYDETLTCTAGPYAILAKGIKSLTAYPKAGTTVYDSLTDLDDLADYLTVIGFDSGDNSKEIFGFTLSCRNWGNGPGTYTVTVTYGGKSNTVDVTVYENKLVSLSIGKWRQSKMAVIDYTTADKLNDYGVLEVKAHYLDGSTKVIPMAKNGQPGYTLSGEFTKKGKNKVTVSYTELNPFTKIAYSSSTTFDVQTEGVKMVSADYALKPGQFCFREGEDLYSISQKMVITAVYNNETRKQVPIYDPTSSQTSYFEILDCYYAGNKLEFIVNVFDEGNIVSQIFSVPTVEIEVVDIRVEVDYADKRYLLIVDSVEHVKNYLKVTEIYNDGTTRVISNDKYTLKRTGGDNPIASGNKLSEGKNYFTVGYTADGKSYSKLATLDVLGICIVSMNVTVNSTYADSEGQLKEGYLFAGDSYTRFSKYITVTATYNDGSIKTVDVTGYNVSGDFITEDQFNMFTVEIVDSNNTVFTQTFYAYVTPVFLTAISAKFNQGTKVVYANTPASQLAGNITLTANFNNGASSIVTGGFTVEPTGGFFTEGITNTLTVSYGGMSCVASGNVKITPKAFSHITLNVVQGGSVIYASASYVQIADYLEVSQHFNDGTEEELAYGTGGYSISGDLLKGETLKVKYLNSEVPVTGLSVTPLAVVNILNVTDKPTMFYASFGLESLKSYIKVLAMYNDAQVREVPQSDYTLSGSLNLPTNIITVNAGISEPYEFELMVMAEDEEPVTITGIQSIAINQNSESKPIYASCELNSIRDYLRVTVLLSDNTTTVVDSNSFNISGRVNADGTYNLSVKVDGLDATRAVPSGLVILPVAPKSISVENSQKITDLVYSGTSPENVAKYLTVTVVNNDGSKINPGYGGDEGYELLGYLVVYDDAEDCELTVSYMGLTAQTTFLVSPKTVENVTAELTRELPTIFYSTVFDSSDVFVLANLTAFVKLSDYLEVKIHYNDDSFVTTNAYSIVSGAVKVGSTVEEIKENGGFITITVNVSGCTTPAKFDIPIVAVKPQSISAEMKTDAEVFVSDTQDSKIVAALEVTLTYNDGTTRILSHASGEYTMFATGNTQNKLIGGDVIYTMYYIENGNICIIDGTPVMGTATVYITPVLPVSLQITVDSSVDIYTTSSENDLRSVLTVNAINNDGSATTDITDYDILPYTLAQNPNFPLTISYTVGEKTVTKVCNLNVQEAGIASIGVDTSRLIGEGGTQIQDVFRSDGLESVLNYITVKGYDALGNEFGEISNYTLSLQEGTWDAGTFTVVVSYENYFGVTLTDTFQLNVLAYALSSVTLLLDNDGLVIFEDYNLADIKEDLKSRLIVSAVWSDGYNHADDYTFEVRDITAGASSTRIRVFYAYYKTVNGDTTTKEQVMELTLTAIKVVKLEVIMNDNYNLYTSDLLENVTTLSTLRATTNKGTQYDVQWADYRYSLSASGWSAGGDIQVTAQFDDDSLDEELTDTFTVTVSAVQLESISATYSQTGVLFASSTLADIISCGTLIVTGTNNDGSSAGVLTVNDTNLSGELTVGQCDLTVTYTQDAKEFVTTFTVTVTGVAVESLTATLKAGSVIYSNNFVGTLSKFITVQAVFNDGSRQTIGYGEDGYEFVRTTILNPTDESVFITVTVSYGGQEATIDNVEILPDKLESIAVFYSQKAPLYQNGGMEAVSGTPNNLSVIATYQESGATVLPASQYTVFYIVDGEETTSLPASGVCTLTVVHYYNGERFEQTFNVTITAKAAVGIGARYEQSQTIFTTTLLEELVKDCGTVTAKGTLTVFTVFNDGTEEDLAISFGDYTLSGTLEEGESVIFVDYGSYETSFKVNAMVPEITGITANLPTGTEIYTNYTDSKIKSLLTVTGDYNDDHTDSRNLSAIQYTLLSDTSTVGEKTFVLTANSMVTTLDVRTELNVVVKQLVNTYTNFQYLSKGEWKNVPDSGLATSATGYTMRLTFVAADGNSTVKTMTVAPDPSIWSVKSNHTITNITVDNNDDGLYVVAPGFSVNLTLIDRAIVSITASYEVKEGQTIFTTNTIEELLDKIVLTFFYLYNDGEEESVDSDHVGDYSLEGSLATAGINNLVLTCNNFPPIYFKVVAEAPSVQEITVGWKDGFKAYYGYTEAQIKNGLQIVGKYNDDGVNRTPDAVLNINSQVNISFTRDGNPAEPITLGLYGVNVSVAHITGYSAVADAATTVEIVPAPITSDCIGTIADEQYTGSQVQPLPVVTVNGKVLNVGVDFYCTYGTNLNVGEGSLTVVGQGNYCGEASINFTIIKSNNGWTVAPAIADWVYGQVPSDPVGQAMFGEVVFTYELMNGSDLGEERPSNVGTYCLLATVVEGENYKSLSQKVTFSIGAAQITDCTAGDVQFVYNGTMQYINENTFSATVAVGSQLVWKFCVGAVPADWGGSDITSVGFTTASDNAVVYYQVSATNHIPIEGSFNVEVKRAPLTVTPKAVTTVYGEEVVFDGVDYDGFVGGDNASVLEGILTYSTNYQSFGDVGSTYEIYAAGYSSDRYEFTYMPGQLTVTQRAITVNITDVSSAFGSPIVELTATVTVGSIVNGDMVYTLTTTATETEIVGHYPIVGTCTNNNYTVTFTGTRGSDGDYEIVPADITGVTINGYNGVYVGAVDVVDGETAAVTMNEMVAGWLFSMDEEQDKNYTATMPQVSAVGTYTVYFKISADNHNDYFGSFTVTVEKATLRLIMNDIQAPVGKEATYSYRVEGLVEGENAEDVLIGYEPICAYTIEAAVGDTFPISATATADNYIIEIVDGLLTVTDSFLKLKDESPLMFTVLVNGKLVEVNIEEYAGGEDIYLKGLTDNVKWSVLKTHFENVELFAVNYQGKTLTDTSIVGTGAVISIAEGSSVVVIVTGDMTGDGKVNATDNMKLKNHILKKSLLDGYFLVAADITGDGKVNATDNMKLKNHILKKTLLFVGTTQPIEDTMTASTMSVYAAPAARQLSVALAEAEAPQQEQQTEQQTVKSVLQKKAASQNTLRIWEDESKRRSLHLDETAYENEKYGL